MSVLLLDQLNGHTKQMFEYLCDSKGFSITRSVFDTQFFGNIQVVASCAEFGVDYRVDRGDESVFVVVEGSEYLIEDALRVAGDSTCKPSHIRDEEEWLRSHVDVLKESFREDRRNASLRLLDQSRTERLRRMFPGAVVGDG